MDLPGNGALTMDQLIFVRQQYKIAVANLIKNVDKSPDSMELENLIKYQGLLSCGSKDIATQRAKWNEAIKRFQEVQVLSLDSSLLEIS